MDIYTERIKPLFDSTGLSDAELEKRIGLPKGKIYDWNSGRNKSYKKYVDKISRYFAVSSDYLLGVEGYYDGIGTAIRLERQEHNETTAALAEYLDISENTLAKYESDIYPIPDNIIEFVADHYGMTTEEFLKKYNCGQDIEAAKRYNNSFINDSNLSNEVAYYEIAKAVLEKRAQMPEAIPVLGTIRAGAPILAEENIIGYDFADVLHPEEYFFLRVTGDSMINAGIKDGSKVLVHKQDYADDGQIVVCLINGHEATLKRFRRKKGICILMPENPAYEPIIVSYEDFKTGNARILGVAKKVLSDL